MKKILFACVALTLGGCATQPIARPQIHVVPTHVKAAPVVTVAPAAPVPPATFKMRWSAVKSHVHFFHQKKSK